jgi:heme-degrading monooxygenase HmoA
MVARVTLAEIDVVRRSPRRGIEMFEQSVIPALQQQEGYLGAYLFLSKEGKLAVISFWSDEETAQASRESGFYEEQIAKFTPELAIFSSKPGREMYDVIVADAPAKVPA